MNLRLCRPSLLMIRPWTLEDVTFSLKVRNHPKLKRWFRQEEDLTLEDQTEFIKHDISAYGTYNGLVIEADGEKVGLCGVKADGEFTIGILPEHQNRGISTWVMKQLVEREYNVWSEVFVGNPALEFFISKCGFKIVSVKERAYHKKGIGLIDVVKIVYEQPRNH
jgi:RimJ/RimL family protein N-acetyltransferase